MKAFIMSRHTTSNASIDNIQCANHHLHLNHIGHSRSQRACQRTRSAGRCIWSLLLVTASLASLATILLLQAQPALAASGRVHHHHVNRQTNQYFLNEFCDLESKAARVAKTLKQADTNSVFLTAKNTRSSMRVLPQIQKPPSTVSFGFGSSSSQPTAPIFKQLNCSIIVVAPKSHGLVVNVNSIGLPRNLTKLGITLNHDSPHAQQIHLEGETTSANYLLTEPSSSKIAINLQSFEPIDWSKVYFDILFTVYKKSNGTTCPNKNWFDCGDNICVPSSLVCDNNRNCPNGNDELVFYRCYSPLFLSIAASTLLSLIVVTIIVVTILIVRRKKADLSKQHASSSDNVLASDGDLIHDNNSSKLDLTQESAGKSNTYLANNLYLSGFENPVWTNGTLTKQRNS